YSVKRNYLECDIETVIKAELGCDIGVSTKMSMRFSYQKLRCAGRFRLARWRLAYLGPDLASSSRSDGTRRGQQQNSPERESGCSRCRKLRHPHTLRCFRQQA